MIKPSELRDRRHLARATHRVVEDQRREFEAPKLDGSERKVSILCSVTLDLDGRMQILVQIPPFVPVSTIEVIDEPTSTSMLAGEYVG